MREREIDRERERGRERERQRDRERKERERERESLLGCQMALQCKILATPLDIMYMNVSPV